MHAEELIFFVPEDTAANYVALSLCQWFENESVENSWSLTSTLTEPFFAEDNVFKA